MSTAPSQISETERATVRKSLEGLSTTIEKVYVEADELLSTLGPILLHHDSEKSGVNANPPEPVQLIGEIEVMHNNLQQSLGIIRLIRDHLCL